ncbi:hypothetical protein ACF0H5_000944 [Mactra antiquata]
MAIGGHSFLQELQNIDTESNFKHSNPTVTWGNLDDDDDASFELEITEIKSPLTCDFRLAEAISAIKKENAFHGTNVNSSNDAVSTEDDKGTEDATEKDNLKQELRTKIQSRRLSQGVGEMTVTFEAPKSYPLSAEERHKVELRKKRNRDSANKSRIRRKEYTDKLLKEVKFLQDQNEKLEKEIRVQQHLRDTLKHVLDGHMAECASNTSSMECR